MTQTCLAHSVTRHRLLYGVSFSLVTVTGLSCRDAGAPPTAPPAALPQPASRDFNTCIDYTQPGCDVPPPSPTDTHVSADIAYGVTYTTTMNESFVDPITGQTTNVLTVTPPDLQVHVDAGYTGSGQVLVNTSYSDGADNHAPDH
jgi:hypothetical protein